MVRTYIDVVIIRKVLLSSGISNKYHNLIVTKQLDACTKFIYNHIHKWSPYQNLASKFFSMLNKFGTTNEIKEMSVIAFNTKISEKCTDKNMQQFITYTKYNAQDFFASTYIVDLCQTSIQNVIDCFKPFSLGNSIRRPYILNQILCDHLNKIFTNYMLVNMASLLYQLEILLKLGVQNFIEYQNLTQIFRKSILENKDIDDILNDNESDLVKTLEDSEDDFSDERRECVKIVYEELKIRYNFMTTSTNDDIVEFCKNKPDFEALIMPYCLQIKLTSITLFGQVIGLSRAYLTPLMTSDKHSDKNTAKLRVSITKFGDNQLIIEV